MEPKKQAMEWASKTNVPIIVVAFGIGWVLNYLSPKYEKYLQVIARVEAMEKENTELLNEVKFIRSDINKIKTDIEVIKVKINLNKGE